VLGQSPWNNPALMRHVGLCPEQDAFYEWMTGFDFARTCARLTGMGRRAADEAAEKALATVGMTENMHRAIRGYSKGMRQRTKLAHAFGITTDRSEEHTSELQSRFDLVCRLLLEKKRKASDTPGDYPQ